MPSRAFPLVAWGTVDAINASPWTDNGTPGVTGSQPDPFGGTGAYVLNDNDGASAEARYKVLSALNASRLGWVICIQQGSSSTSLVAVRDQTAAAYAIDAPITYSGGVPSSTPNAGTLIGKIALGGGWYALIFDAAWISGHVPRIELYATGGTAGLTGTTVYYHQNMVLLDLLGTPKAFSRPAAGYEAVTAPSGVRDAWKVNAPDEVLQGRISWVPTTARSFPQIVSGWDGQNEAVGVNCGVKAMLEAGWDMNLLRVATDRSVCTTYNDAYLTQPGQDWAPELEGNADRALNLELVSSTPFSGF